MRLSKLIESPTRSFSDQLIFAQNSILNQQIGLKLLLNKT